MLLKRFVVSGVDWAEGRDDPFKHLAGVMTNATRLPQGRKLLLQPGRGLLQALVSQLQSPCEMRRRGCAGALKNCIMTAEVRRCRARSRGERREGRGVLLSPHLFMPMMCPKSTLTLSLHSFTPPPHAMLAGGWEPGGPSRRQLCPAEDAQAD